MITHLGFLAALAMPAVDDSGPWLELADPAHAGFAPELLEQARRHAERVGSAAVFAVHRGHVVVAWGAIEQAFECHSVRKSLLSALYGPLVAAGSIDLDGTLAQQQIDDVPPLTDIEKQARVRDLLTSRSGVYHAAAKEPADMKRERPARGSHTAGEHFFYNNWDFNTAGVVLARAAGHSVGEEFTQRLADPLGMEDFDPEEHAFEQLEPSSSIHPAYAFRLSARDLARVGRLYLQRGRWDGEPLVPEAWIDESTKAHTRFEDGRGYGFMWWVYPARSLAASAGFPVLDRCDKFAAIGTGGQFLLVVPAADFLFVHRADTDHGREVRGGDVWRLAEMILAARTGEGEKEPRLVELAATPLPGALPPLPRRIAIATEPAALREYVGTYSGKGLDVKLFLHENRLFALAVGQGEAELLAESRDHYFAKGTNLTVVFERDPAGAVVAARVSVLGRESRAGRVADSGR